VADPLVEQPAIGEGWENIQQQIDYDYQRKLKQVSDEANQKLLQFQKEHQEQLRLQKDTYTS
jgi:hypothetical protein